MCLVEKGGCQINDDVMGFAYSMHGDVTIVWDFQSQNMKWRNMLGAEVWVGDISINLKTMCQAFLCSLIEAQVSKCWAQHNSYFYSIKQENVWQWVAVIQGVLMMLSYASHHWCLWAPFAATHSKQKVFWKLGVTIRKWKGQGSTHLNGSEKQLFCIIFNLYFYFTFSKFKKWQKVVAACFSKILGSFV